MKVSRELLLAVQRAFDEVAEKIDALDAISGLSRLGTAMPDSAIARAADNAGPYVEGAYLRVAERLRDMAEIASANATDYSATEDDFAARMAATGVLTP
ncbi:hypothetical protein G419_24069 [Rhodococcus triatomae BKS 15-14]|nr:hypothetical protein G419_24069 [Rhodococcus triatomae BKS 15-14]